MQAGVRTNVHTATGHEVEKLGREKLPKLAGEIGQVTNLDNKIPQTRELRSGEKVTEIKGAPLDESG